MEQILLASLLFLSVFSIDYLRHWLKPDRYQYVSRETYLLFIVAVIAAFTLFSAQIAEFTVGRFHVELFYLLLLFFIALISSIGIVQEKIEICSTILRTKKCISPFYVLVKAKELLFQQIVFLMIALGVSREIGTDFSGLLTYLIVVSLIQIPILFHVKPFWRKVYVPISLFFSVIFFYTYVYLELFWPAVYVHVLIYAFFWITLAEPSSNEDNWGKDRG